MLQVLVGVISLLPLPPLEGGRLLFLFTPKTLGWQKAEYQLAERNIGLVHRARLSHPDSSGIVPPFAYLADVITHGVALLAAKCDRWARPANVVGCPQRAPLLT